MLILRPIVADDLDDLVVLASQLDSINLPSDRDFLRDRIAHSIRSFAEEEEVPARIYVFVLEDTDAGRCVGTCSILAKHGVPGHPYFWLEVSTEERHSVRLGKRFTHKKLRLRSTEDGPSEIGGLILDPAYRSHPQKCGKALSGVRFAFISIHPDRFEREIIAEMLSPFEAPGENLLWEAFGAHFTGMAYKEADRLSASDKQFIADLFPRDAVYATLFPQNVQDVIGQANENSIAAVRILEKQGFHDLNQVDPFDGGPYFGASRDSISSVRERRRLVLPGEEPELEGDDDHDNRAPGTLALLSAEDDANGFRATVVRLDAEGTPRVSSPCRKALCLAAGDRVHITPLP